MHLDQRIIDSWLDDAHGTQEGLSWRWDPEASLGPGHAPGAYHVTGTRLDGRTVTVPRFELFTALLARVRAREQVERRERGLE